MVQKALMNPNSRSRRPDFRQLGGLLFAGLQFLLPHHFLTGLVYRITRIEWPSFKNTLIRLVIRIYSVDMAGAAEPDPTRYRSFNDFFTRTLKPSTRPIAPDKDLIISPVDGSISQLGEIRDGAIFQAKGFDYSLLELLGGDHEWCELFEQGSFATLYLSPRDYHRVHMPCGGALKKMIHVPGRLFSVNDTTTRLVPRLFTRNERVISLFETDLGPMAVILVGALFVASIETVWAGTITPVSRQPRSWEYPPKKREKTIKLAKGDEMGRFNMGSTVILLFGKGAVRWDDAHAPGQSVYMGERIGSLDKPEMESQKPAE